MQKEPVEASANLNNQVQIGEETEKRRQLTGFWGYFVALLAILTTLFHLAALTIYPLDPWIFRAISLGLLAILTFLLLPGSKRKSQSLQSVQFIDILFAMLSAAIMIYLGLTYKEMYYRVGFAATTLDWIFGFLAVVVAIEMARRLMGWVLPVIAIVFVVYTLFGGPLPGILGHRGYPFDRLMSVLISSEGIYGMAMSAASTYIVLFVTFGAFLRASGVGDFFIRFAMALAGAARGGPAKVAVFASALFGTVSGSAMGNVVTTGTFTIPLMKRIGYRPFFAGAVEAAASTGGQIMPPVMGAVAFVLAEAAGVPYREVMIAAVIPAIIYFTAVYFMIDFEAIKQGLKGLPRKDLPRLWLVVSQGWHLLIPILLFIYLIVFQGRSIVLAALYCILAALIVSWFKRMTRIGGIKLLEALKEGALGSLEAAAACGVAGIVVGVLTLTGLGQRLGMLILTIAAGNLPLTLVLIMIIAIILGMGMPTVPAYILAASVGVPPLVQMGVPGLAAHLFVMYFACISTITPPVALAAYAGAGIAKADPNRTGWQAMKLGLAAYIVPFMFIYNPVLLWNGEWHEILLSIVTACLGAYGLAAAVGSNYNPVLRIVMAGAAITLIFPGLTTDLIGLFLLIGSSVIQYFLNRNQQGKVVGG